MRNFIEKVLDFLFPKRCITCAEYISGDIGLCSKCWLQVQFLSDPLCKKCGYPIEYDNSPCPECSKKSFQFDFSRSAFIYDAFSKQVIIDYKHKNALYLTPILSGWLWRLVSEIPFSCDLIIPVPLHWTKLLKRTYNQSELLGKMLSETSKIPIEIDILLKHKKTKAQEDLNFKERYDNLQNVFSIKRDHKIKGKNILLIDDVFTTGTTINECVATLKNAGAEKVGVLTLGRVLL